MVLSLSRVPLRARIRIAVIGLALFASVAWVTTRIAGAPAGERRFDDVIGDHAAKMLEDGRRTFRFDTFGDEAFWGDALHLHRTPFGRRLPSGTRRHLPPRVVSGDGGTFPTREWEACAFSRAGGRGVSVA